jgi:hypothetical protein
MTLNRVARWLAMALGAGAVWLGFMAPAQAIPVFARQTGHNCQACHISYPELTPYGREFKLNGYTFGEAQKVPLAFAMMAEYTKSGDASNHNPAGPANVCDINIAAGVPDSCAAGQFVQWSLFAGGRLTENLGLFWQYSSGTYPFGQTSAGGNNIGGGQDNTEMRYVHRFNTGSETLEDDTVVGLLVNNNPTMQDVWHSVPAWRFPWFPYTQPGLGPVATPFIDGTLAHRSTGLGAYVWAQKHWYAELTLYRKPWGPFSWLSNGDGNATTTAAGLPNTQPSDTINGYAPYYRLAYSRDYGYSSAEVGIFGMHTKTFYNPDPYVFNAPTAPATVGPFVGNNFQQYNDIAVDAQYQFNRNEPFIFGLNASVVHETISNSAQFQADKTTSGGAAPNASNTLNEFNVRGTVYYDRKYGATLAYNVIAGTKDNALYGSIATANNGPGMSAVGSPNTNSWMVEFNYLPLQDIRLSFFYRGYNKLNGGTSKFDGYNNASGQNTFAFAAWWIF